MQSIKAQSYPNIEIIVVDNGSIDKTEEIVLSFGNSEKMPVSFFFYGTERSTSRNYGLMQKAKGEYAMFLDAEIYFEENFRH